MLWIGLIQDFSFCEKEVASHVCVSEGWAYKMAITISHLDPHFRALHFNAPLMLTVVVNDIGGASKLLDRSVELFPGDWQILYTAAYQALVEEKNKNKAATLFLNAARSGGPKWFYDASVKLYTEGGEVEVAHSVVQSLREKKDIDSKLLETMEERVKMLSQ
jgi:hypothetical protein